jgi:hypothetical protein
VTEGVCLIGRPGGDGDGEESCQHGENIQQAVRCLRQNADAAGEYRHDYFQSN